MPKTSFLYGDVFKNKPNARHGCVEFLRVLDPKDVDLFDPRLVVENAGPAVDVDPVIPGQAYSDLVDSLQVAGVHVLDAVRYAKSMITTNKDASTLVAFYGSGRLCGAAHARRRALNVQGLGAFDLRTIRRDGQPWDFRKKSHRVEAEAYVREQKPEWLIGSPPCTPFCNLNQYLNYPKLPREQVQKLKADGMLHLTFMCRLYRLKSDGGRFFLHEHPQTAVSWVERCMLKTAQLPNVDAVVGDLCQFGLMVQSKDGSLLPAKKPTKWMSNSPWMLQRLAKRCLGDHQHHTLLGGKAHGAEEYPIDLVVEILRGTRDTRDMKHNTYDENDNIINAYFENNSGFGHAASMTYSVQDAPNNAVANIPSSLSINYVSGEKRPSFLACTLRTSIWTSTPTTRYIMTLSVVL